MEMLKPEKISFVSSIGSGFKVVGFFYPSSASEIKGVVQICHGMAEYLERYREMIIKLNEAGYHVCGMDMPGHGQTYYLNKEAGYPKGYFGGVKDSWKVLLTDEMGMHEYAVRRFGKGLKYILYGHSMGSFVVRSIFSTPRYHNQFDGYVFASTMGPNPAVGLGKFLAGTGCVFGGAKKPDKLLTFIAFGSYTKRIKGAKTSYDWLSTDPDEVQKYIDDPMCGFYFTSEGFKTLFSLVAFMQSKTAYAQIPDRPCFFVYSDEDPVGSYAAGVESVIDKMKSAGARVRAKNYGPYRHEIMNEPVKEEYFADIIDFLNEVTSA